MMGSKEFLDPKVGNIKLNDSKVGDISLKYKKIINYINFINKKG